MQFPESWQAVVVYSVTALALGMILAAKLLREPLREIANALRDRWAPECALSSTIPPDYVPQFARLAESSEIIARYFEDTKYERFECLHPASHEELDWLMTFWNEHHRKPEAEASDPRPRVRAPALRPYGVPPLAAPVQNASS
jgi:hypothetical protein